MALRKCPKGKSTCSRQSRQKTWMKRLPIHGVCKLPQHPSSALLSDRPCGWAQVLLPVRRIVQPGPAMLRCGTKFSLQGSAPHPKGLRQDSEGWGLCGGGRRRGDSALFTVKYRYGVDVSSQNTVPRVTFQCCSPLMLSGGTVLSPHTHGCNPLAISCSVLCSIHSFQSLICWGKWVLQSP